MSTIDPTGLVKYDAMQHAIVLATAVDEVKDIRDKAAALEKYAQQARNFDAEHRCAKLRIFAEAKAGQMLRAMDKAKGAKLNGRDKSGNHRASSDTSTEKKLSDLGITYDQSSQWQQLAAHPEKVDEYLATSEQVPTTAGALAYVKPSKKPKAAPPPHPFTDDALWVWGRIGDLDRHGIKPQDIADGCDPATRAKLIDHLDHVIPVLKQLRDLL